MKPAVYSCALALLGALIGCGILFPPGGRVIVTGTVYLDDAPLEDASIHIEGPNRGNDPEYTGPTTYGATRTGPDGTYRVSFHDPDCDGPVWVRAYTDATGVASRTQTRSWEGKDCGDFPGMDFVFETAP